MSCLCFKAAVVTCIAACLSVCLPVCVGCADKVTDTAGMSCVSFKAVIVHVCLPAYLSVCLSVGGADKDTADGDEEDAGYGGDDGDDAPAAPRFAVSCASLTAQHAGQVGVRMLECSCTWSAAVSSTCQTISASAAVVGALHQLGSILCTSALV